MGKKKAMSSDINRELPAVINLLVSKSNISRNNHNNNNKFNNKGNDGDTNNDNNVIVIYD